MQNMARAKKAPANLILDNEFPMEDQLLDIMLQSTIQIENHLVNTLPLVYTI